MANSEVYVIVFAGILWWTKIEPEVKVSLLNPHKFSKKEKENVNTIYQAEAGGYWGLSSVRDEGRRGISLWSLWN